MGLGHLLVCKSKNLGSWVYRLMIQFIVVSSFFLQDYISFIFSLVFFFFVFFYGVVVFLSYFLGFMASIIKEKVRGGHHKPQERKKYNSILLAINSSFT